MVDAFTKQVLQNGPRVYIALFTVVFTGTGNLTAYEAIDPTATGDMGVNIAGNVLYPGTQLKIWELKYDLSESVGLEIYWDATTPQDAYLLNGIGSGRQNFKHQGGLYVPQSAGAPIAGATGKLFFNTLGTPAAGKIISVQMTLKKDIAQ